MTCKVPVGPCIVLFGKKDLDKYIKIAADGTIVGRNDEEIFGMVSLCILPPRDGLEFPFLPSRICQNNREEEVFHVNCRTCCEQRVSNHVCDHSDEERMLYVQTTIHEINYCIQELNYSIQELFECYYFKEGKVLFESMMRVIESLKLATTDKFTSKLIKKGLVSSFGKLLKNERTEETVLVRTQDDLANLVKESLKQNQENLRAMHLLDDDALFCRIESTKDNKPNTRNQLVIGKWTNIEIV